MNLVKRSDIQEKIHGDITPYLVEAKKAAALYEGDAPVFLKTMVDGILKVAEHISVVSYKMGDAKKQRKRSEAIAALESFPEYAKSKGIKGTSDQMGHFVNIQEEVLSAVDDELYYSSMLEYLYTVRDALRMAHDDAKKTVYSRMGSSNDYTG